MPTLNQMHVHQERGIVAAAGRIGDASPMISRRKAAGYGLSLAATAVIVFFLAPLVYGMLIWMGWVGERDEALPNGYRFVELSRGNGAITKGTDFAVYPNVAEHRVRGSIITGRRVLAADNTDGSAPFTTGLGYFVLNTATGQLKQGQPPTAYPSNR
jgi:hypothetical protein